MDTIIPINRKKFPIPLVISICIALITIAILYRTRSFTLDPYSPASLLVILLFMNIRVILVLGKSYKRLRTDKSLGLTVTDTGIVDNLTKFTFGFIPWRDIDAVAMDKFRRTNILLIGLRNNDKYAARTFPQRLRIFKSYVGKWNTPFVISEDWIDYKLEDLRDLILDKSGTGVNSYELR